jgi:hypothetical protein
VARLTGGPLRTSATRGLLAGSRRALTHAGGLGVTSAVRGALLAVDPIDGRAGLLPGGPLNGIIRLGAERTLRISDVVGPPVVLDLGGRLAPGPPAPGRRRNRAQRLEDVAGAVGFDRC